jgi:Lar family restriction alleviation protein
MTTKPVSREPLAPADDLLLCPFCGGKAVHVTGPMFHNVPRSSQVYMRYVMCLSCNNSTAMCDTREKAAELWNARVYVRPHR